MTLTKIYASATRRMETATGYQEWKKKVKQRFPTVQFTVYGMGKKLTAHIGEITVGVFDLIKQKQVYLLTVEKYNEKKRKG